MSQRRTILCFASGYDAPPTSKHHVMHLLAQGHTVLWVNYHASRMPSVSGSDARYMLAKLAEVGRGLTRRRPGLYTLTPLVLPLPGSAAARKLNRMLLVGQIRRALAQIRTGPIDIWSFAPDIGYLVDAFRPERLVYYCVDDHAAFSGYDAEQVRRDEIDLCRRADLVVTTSAALQRAREGDNPNTICVPHGVDYEHFAAATTTAEPAELAEVPHPRLGFFGLIRDWVDLDLLAGLAQRRPAWQIVLLGDSTVDTAALDALPNVHHFGRRPYGELPGWCAGFDVGLIPFKVNELTHAVNPIKLREYLAAGLPVVSTPMPEVQACNAPVRIAEGLDAYEAAVEQALADARSPAVRRDLQQAMRAETWPAKLATIEQALAEAVASRRRQGRAHARPTKVMVTLCGGGFASYTRLILARAPEQVELLLATPEPMADWLASDLPNAVAYREGLRYRVCQVPEQRSRNHGGPIETLTRLVRGLVGCWRVIARERPQAVVGVAASLSIPLLIAARLAGIRTVFVESLTRVRHASRTGRIVSLLRLADRIYVQWPRARRLYAGARYEGRLA